MRIPRRYLVRALAYPLLLGGILLALKSQDDFADIGPYWRKLQDVREVRPQTLFLGSSRTMRHVDPVRFDSLHGKETLSYNFGLAGSRSLETHFRADLLLEQDLPGLERLIVEFGPVDLRIPERAMHTRRIHHYHDARRAAIGSRVAMAANAPLQDRASLAGNRWKFWTMNTFLVGWGRALVNGTLIEAQAEKRQKPVGRRGFIPLRDTGAPGLASRRAQLLSPTGQAELQRRIQLIQQRDAYRPTERDRVTAEAWIDLAARARARGVEMVFVEQVGTEAGAGVTALVREALGEEAVIVLNDPMLYPEFFEAEAWFDIGHLRENMAAGVTDVLAQRLAPLE